MTFRLIGALAMCMSAGLMSTASAEVIWRDGVPIFQSDGQSSSSYSSTPRRAPGKPYPKFMDGGARPHITPQAPSTTRFPNSYGRGTVVVDTRGRKLYYTLSRSHAYVYPISVGRRGFQWTGRHKITRKQSWPSWTPPAEMRKRQPYLPVRMDGGIQNPLGAKALYLGSTLYRIHGTNNPNTIGRATSSGCFRMMNKHVLHLSRLVKVGTPVVVKRSVRSSQNTSATSTAASKS